MRPWRSLVTSLTVWRRIRRRSAGQDQQEEGATGEAGGAHEEESGHIDRLELIILRMDNDELEPEDVDASRTTSSTTDSAPDDDGSVVLKTVISTRSCH